MTALRGTGDLLAHCAAVLSTSDPVAKAKGAGRAARLAMRDDRAPGDARCPNRPARPERPVLLAPRAMPKRKPGSPQGRAALLHALAHIELNAIDLALDIAVRFGGPSGPLPPDQRLPFCRDWLDVARDEAKHFLLLTRRMRQLGVAYGDFPAHDGLWTAAERTKDDLLARLAIVPLVHEARGLDVQPTMIARLRLAGDLQSARVLEVIAADEIGHVRTGYRWFVALCAGLGIDAATHYRMLVATHHGALGTRDFDHLARSRAGLPKEFYEF